MFRRENELWATQIVRSVFFFVFLLKQEQHEREVWEEFEETESSCCLQITSLHTGLQTHSAHIWLTVCVVNGGQMWCLRPAPDPEEINLHHSLTRLWTMRAETAAQTEQLAAQHTFHRAWRSWDEELSLRKFPLRNKRWEKTAQSIHFGF